MIQDQPRTKQKPHNRTETEQGPEQGAEEDQIKKT